MIEGRTIVGYRFGKAPENGYSWNYQTQQAECGVSMASVGYVDFSSFAVCDADASRKKYYYVGTIAGWGGDDEICLTDVRQISAAEYRKLRIETKQVSNDIVDHIADRRCRLIRAGYHVGSLTLEDVEEWRVATKM